MEHMPFPSANQHQYSTHGVIVILYHNNGSNAIAAGLKSNEK